MDFGKNGKYGSYSVHEAPFIQTAPENPVRRVGSPGSI